MLIPIDQYKKSAPRQQTFGKLKPLAPKPARVASAPVAPTMPKPMAPRGDGYASNVPQWMKSTDQGLKKFSQAAANTPKFTFADNIKNPVGRVLAGAAQDLVNTPSNFVRGAFGTYGQEVTPSNLLKGAGQAANVGLNVASVPGVGSVVKQGIKQGIKPAIISGAKSGAGYGAAYGASTGIQEGDNVGEQSKNALSQALFGGVTGGILGGALGAGGSVAGRYFKKEIKPLTPREGVSQISGVSGTLAKKGEVTPKIDVSIQKIEDPFNFNVSKKIQRNLKDVRRALDKTVDDATDFVKDQRDQTGGVTSVYNYNEFAPGTMEAKRITSNPKWYRDYYAENGHAPSKKAIHDMVKDAIDGKNTSMQVPQDIIDEYRRLSSIGKSLQRNQSKINPDIFLERINKALAFGEEVPVQKNVSVGFTGSERAKIPVKWSRDPKTIPERIGLMSADAPTGSKYYPNIFRSGESSLSNQGQAGETLKNLMKDEQVSADLQAGKWKSLVKKFTSQLDDAQRNNLTDVLEGKANPVDKAVADSSVVMRNLLNKIQRTAKDTGLDVGYREDYFPRQYNWDEITKGNRHEEVLQHMVESGQAGTKAEAESFLNDFIGKNRERKAGNLEYERLFDIPGYEKDPEKALTMYADSAAKRINEARSFGAKDEVSSALINKIAEGGGDYTEAQKIFDNVYKGEDKNAFAQFLLGYNAFTKLSLGFFSNLTQSVNTASKAGLLNTVKGAGQALAQGIKAVKGKNYDDLAVLANTLDDHVMLQESGLSNKFIQGSMYLFQKVENFNRRTATYAGKYRAEELANILKSDPQSAFASRQLESLGIKVEDIVNGKLTQEQLAKAANKMTRITQFKIDSLNLPTAWRTPLGKVLSQFKSFSFMQTKFIRDEIVKEARLGNFAPLARFIAIAPMASFLTQSARNAVNQVDPKNEKANPSFRKGDLYRKAIGDLPSDFVTQMKYAYDKSQATYQDAKGNEYPSTTALQDIKNFSSPFTGPSVSDAAELMSSIDRVSSVKERNNAWYGNHEAAQSDPYLDLKRFATTKIPFVGRGLTNRFFPYEKTDAKKAKELFKEGLRTNNRDLIDQAIKDDPYLYNEKVVRSVIGGKVKDMSQKERELYEEIRSMKKSGQPFYK